MSAFSTRTLKRLARGTPARKQFSDIGPICVYPVARITLSFTKNELEIANVFAGLLTVIFIGLIIDSLVFRQIEARTLRRWGMQSH